MSSNNKCPPLTFTEFIPSAVSFTEPAKNEYSKTQKIGFVRYDHPKLGQTGLVLQTPSTVLERGGIPPLNETYCKTDEQRENMKFPLNEQNKKSLLMVNKLSELDNVVTTKFAPLFFKNKISKYQYTSIVREPNLCESDEEDDEETKNKKVKKNESRMKYFKAKFDVDFKTKAMKTLFYRKLSSEESAEVGKKREQIFIKTMTEASDFVKFGSNVKLIVSVNKLWVSTTPNDSGKYTYGVGLKILQIEVESSKPTNITNSFGQDAFLSEESDDDAPTKKLDTKEEEEEEGDAEDEYEEVEVAVTDKPVQEESSDSEEVVVQTSKKTVKRASR